MNREGSIFQPKPEPEELIEFVGRIFPLKRNEKQEDRQCLLILISKFLSYILRLSKSLEGYEDFYVRDHIGNKFPWENYQETLSDFWKDKNLWANKTINFYLKQEHVCVLFYLAALRYLTMPQPVLQAKYDKDNKSLNPNTDLFLFSKDKDQRAWAAYAVQLKILTREDVERTGELNPISYRAKGYLEKYIQDAQGVREDSIITAKSFCYGCNNKDGMTQNFVVNIIPEETTWDYCRNYTEIVTSSQPVKFTSFFSQSQNTSIEKAWKSSQAQPDLTYQILQNQSNFQLHSTQNIVASKPWMNHPRWDPNFPVNYFLDASQRIPSQNKLLPHDMASVGVNLETEYRATPSTSHQQNRHAFVNHTIIKRVNKYSQYLDHKELRETEESEEIYPVQKRQKM